MKLSELAIKRPVFTVMMTVELFAFPARLMTASTS